MQRWAVEVVLQVQCHFSLVSPVKLGYTHQLECEHTYVLKLPYSFDTHFLSDESPQCV